MNSLRTKTEINIKGENRPKEGEKTKLISRKSSGTSLRSKRGTREREKMREVELGVGLIAPEGEKGGFPPMTDPDQINAIKRWSQKNGGVTRAARSKQRQAGEL